MQRETPKSTQIGKSRKFDALITIAIIRLNARKCTNGNQPKPMRIKCPISVFNKRVHTVTRVILRPLTTIYCGI